MFVALTLPLWALVACGDDDAAAPAGAEYFTTVDASLERFRAASGDEFETLRSSTDLDELEAAAAEMLSILDRFIASVAALEPPPDAIAVHRAAQADAEAYRTKLAEVNASAQAATTVEAFRDVIVDEQLQALFEAFNANCPRLQEAADDEHAGVDFDCPE